MGSQLILATTFLVDLDRENRRGVHGPALTFLELNQDARLYLPFVVAGELAAGVSMRERSKWEAFLAPLCLLPSTPEVSLRQAGIEPFAWVINASLLAAQVTDPVLQQRAHAEVPLIRRVAADLAKRVALVPFQVSEPTGPARCDCGRWLGQISPQSRRACRRPE